MIQMVSMNGRRRSWKRIGDRSTQGLMRHHRMPFWWVHDLIFAAPVSAGQLDKPRGSPVSSDSNLLHMPISPAHLELLKSTPVRAMRWSTRASHALEFARCKNLGDVFSVTEEGWAERRYVGEKTRMEIAERIQKFLKIKCKERRKCHVPSIEQKIRTNQIPAAMAEAFEMSGLTALQIKVLQLRYGLAGDAPHTLEECGRKMQSTRQSMQVTEMNGRGRLSRQAAIFKTVQRGLKDIQGRLWRQLAGNNKTLISKQVVSRELNKRLGGPERLLVKLCYGDLRNWVKKNLTSTSDGWRIPV
jgi:hypothetical protein